MGEISPMKKNPGRPPVPGEKRTRLVQFYLTEKDASTLQRCVDEGKFKGMSTFLTALVEPILQGGLSVQAAARSVNRIQKHMEANGAPFGLNAKILKEAMRDMFAPPPPIPDDVEDLSKLKSDLRALLAELERQTEPKTNKPEKNDHTNRNPAPVRAR